MTVGTTNFPGALDSHTSASPLGFGEVNNQAYTLSTAAHSNSVTTITVASTSAFPSKGYLVIKREIVSYTGTTATTFTGVTRGVGGTTAAAFGSGTLVEQVPVAANHNDLAAAIVAVETVLSGEPPLNAIVNAGLDIWQDGATFTSIADGTWGPDNFVYGKAGAIVHDLLRSTDVPTVAQAQKANYSLHLDVTTADASLAAGDYSSIATRIEGYAWKPFAEKEWSFGFWVKAAKTGVHYVYARNSGNDRSCVMPYTILAADTWEYKTITFPASPSAGTWNYTNGRGIEIGWTISCGSTFHTTAGAWQTGDFKAASDVVNEGDSTANNFRIALIGPPTVGPYAAPYRPADPTIEDYRAARYYEVFSGSAYIPFTQGSWTSTTVAQGAMLYRDKRAATSVTVSAASDLYADNAGTPVTLSTVTVFYPGIRACWFYVTVAAGGTAGYGSFFGFLNTSGQVKIAARIP